MLLHNMCEKQICCSNVKNMAYAQIPQYAYMDEYVNEHATEKAAPINDVAKIAVHRR